MDADPARHHCRAGLRYGSDLTDAEWAILGPFLPPQAKCGRKRAYPMREVVNAMCHVPRGGIAWRLMPDTFPLWRTVAGTRGRQGTAALRQQNRVMKDQGGGWTPPPCTLLRSA